MANKLIVAPAPHVQTAQSTTRIMRDVVIALMPALVVSTVVFGLDVLRVTALSVVSCVVIEYLIQKFMVRGATTVGNWSAVVTGVLLAFNLPASIPWWIVVMGAFVAIAVAKMTFGGLGKNPFNPALVGRVFLLIAYPVQMTTWPLPVNGSFDVLSGATPLAAVKQGLAGPGAIGVQEMLLGNIPGSLGEVAAAALLCGFVYLLWRRVITWHIPVTVLATMAVFAGVVAMCSVSFDALPQAADGTCSAGYKLGYLFGTAWRAGIFHVLAGGAMLGAIFMATDYSTSPMTVRGGVIFGIGDPVPSLAEFCRSYSQALRTVDLASRICDERIATYRRYILCELIYDSPNAKLALIQRIKPLLAYDEEHNTQLLYTLETYFNNCQNSVKTSKALFIHRNTLLYRLDRIAEILDLNYNDSEQMLTFQLALKAFLMCQ